MKTRALVLLSLLTLFRVWGRVTGKAESEVFTKCGGVLEASKGVIHSPDFPNPYPTPIYCEWLIRASPEKKIIIYFTQYYMKDSFYITEYDHYQEQSTYVGRHDLGRISWEHELSFLVAYKPYVLIQFSVESIGNRHLRVIDNLLDVHGFNISYEIVDKSADVTKDTCSVKKCSYLGNCLVNADFSQYKCQCFEGFFGNECQYGPYCDPDNNINQCSNGGRCRYFMGSLINQCECAPGFFGAYCEIPDSDIGEGIDQACKELNCDQLCDHTSEEAYCVCYDGYKMENGTCIPIARFRMDVRLELTSFVFVPEVNLESKLNRAKQVILKTIEQNGVSTVSKFGVKGLSNTTKATVLEFYFYCMVSEVGNVTQALAAVVSLKQVGMFHLRNSSPVFEKSSELHLEAVTNYDRNPTLQGRLLTLVCAAKGSKNMSFQWYKDGHLVNTSLTLRNAWESQIPHTVPDMQLAVLNIDNATPFDKGTFTCEVKDYGESQWGNVAVEVKTYPMVEVDPMSASVIKNHPVSIKCLSPDDSWKKFTYDWYKNGVKLKADNREEYAEDLFPTGVRLVVSKVTDHAQYTCRVTNEAGFANVTSYIFAVLENQTSLYCPRNYEGQVMWHDTSGGHFNIQRCPTEHGDFSLYGPVYVGYARRNCNCDAATGDCTWEKPNFAKCQSLILIHIYDELESLRLGYQQTTLAKVFDDLYEFTLPDKEVILYSGDIDMVAGILRKLVVHMENFPILVENAAKIQATKLLELMSALLEKSSEATPDEKELLLVGPSVIHITSTLFSGALRSLEYASDVALTSKTIDMAVIGAKVHKEPDQNNIRIENHEEFHYSHRQPKVQALVKEDKMPDEVEVVRLEMRTLTDLLQYKTFKQATSDSVMVDPVLVSHVVAHASFEPLNITRKLNGVHIKFDHLRTLGGKNNTTVCLSWNYESGYLYKGQWLTNRCSVVVMTPGYTVCNCKLPGHFAVAVISSNSSTTGEITMSYEVDELLLICYSAALTIALLTLIVYQKTWGELVGELYIVHLSFIVCLFASCVVVVVCLLNFAQAEVLHLVCRMLLFLFFISAFSFLLIEVFHIFISTYNIRQIFFTRKKYFLFGWGISLLAVLTVLITTFVVGNNEACHKLCWISGDHWQFYAFLMPVVVIVVAYLLLLVLCLWTLRQWNEEWRFADRQNYLKSLGKSSHLLLMLLVTTLLMIGMEDDTQKIQTTFHLVFLFGLVLSTLLHRCVFDKQVRYQAKDMLTCGKQKKDPRQRVRSRSSFRTFMKPEKMENGMNQEEYNVSRYYDEVNRTKYTRERKRQLSALLGSSSSGETKSTSVSGSSGENSRQSELTTTDDINSDNAGTDSGEFDYTDTNGSSSCADNTSITCSSKSSKSSAMGMANSAKRPKAKDLRNTDSQQTKPLLCPEIVKSPILEEPSVTSLSDIEVTKVLPASKSRSDHPSLSSFTSTSSSSPQNNESTDINLDSSVSPKNNSKIVESDTYVLPDHSIGQPPSEMHEKHA